MQTPWVTVNTKINNIQGMSSKVHSPRREADMHTGNYSKALCCNKCLTASLKPAASINWVSQPRTYSCQMEMTHHDLQLPCCWLPPSSHPAYKAFPLSSMTCRMSCVGRKAFVESSQKLLGGEREKERQREREQARAQERYGWRPIDWKRLKRHINHLQCIDPCLDSDSNKL